MWLNLIDDETRERTEWVYNLSYGKDSMAGLHVTIDILGIPVSRVVHAEVWATDTIPADLPPMVAFKAKADAYIKARWGLTVEHVYATRGGSADPSKRCSSNDTNVGSTSASSGGSQCSEAHGAKTGSNGQPSIREKLTYEKLFYHVPERKETSKFAGGCKDSLGSKCHGATDISRCQPCGFPHTIGSWCKKLKRLSYQRVSDHQGKLVHQRPQAGKPFQPAPGNEGQREISCICWASLPTNRGVSPGT